MRAGAPTHSVAGGADGHDGQDEAHNTVPPRKREKRPVPQKHQWFDAWKVARGEGLKRLVANTIASVRHNEADTKARTRARKLADEANHLKRIEAVVCNLAHAVLLPPPTGRVAVQLGNRRKGRSRYDSPVLSKALSPLILTLQDLDFLNLKWSTLRGEVSSIAPSPWFVGKVSEHSIQLSDFGRDEAEEVVLLSRNRREVPPWWSQTRERKLYREPIDYADTPETRKFRDAVRRLNALLSDADIEFLDEGLAPRIDPFDRTLRRRFTILPEQDVRFDQGGRLFGGFWQTLKSHRRRHIRINGEPVVVLDYASMFTRLAYAHLGARPPELDDLYAIPGLEGYRKGVKKAMNCFLFDNGPRRSWPSEFSRADDDDHHDDGNDHHDDGAGDHHHQDHEDAAAADGATDGSRRRRGGELRRASTAPLLPTGWGVGRTKKAVLAVHPALKNAWGCRLGYRLMFTESEVLIAVLRQLASLHIPALGLHDGLMVAVSCKDVAEKVMEEVAKEVAGIPLPVSVKGPL